MLGVLPFVEDPDLSWTGGPAIPQLLPPCLVEKFDLLHVHIQLIQKRIGLEPAFGLAALSYQTSLRDLLIGPTCQVTHL